VTHHKHRGGQCNHQRQVEPLRVMGLQPLNRRLQRKALAHQVTQAINVGERIHLVLTQVLEKPEPGLKVVDERATVIRSIPTNSPRAVV
jgi:hypothetical protein